MDVLLIGAVACTTALILSACLMTFAHWFPLRGIDGGFPVDYKTMIRAHVDYALMALFQLGFFAASKAAALNYIILPASAWRSVALPTRPFSPLPHLTLTSGAK
jgi:hypothetical protein